MASRLQTIPPDLRASLQLLLGQRKRYDEIAALLRVEERAVHDRAHAALALLAPRQARELNAEQREQVGEYLLGQADAPQRAAAVTLFEGSPAAREWARALAGELKPIASRPLPEIPHRQAAAVEQQQSAAREPHAVEGGQQSAAREPHAGEERPASSRRGGAILLLGLAAAVVVVVALVIGLGGGSSSPGSATEAGAPGTAGGGTHTTSTSATGGHAGQSGTGNGTSGAGKGASEAGNAGGTNTTGNAGSTSTTGKAGSAGKGGKSGEAKVTATLPLTPPNTSSKALGLVEVVADGHEHAFILAAEHLPPTHGFHYAAWLYNTPTDAFYLGGGTSVGSNGILKAAQGLPRNASRYASIILTEQHEEQPKEPGPIVLNGPFKLG